MVEALVSVVLLLALATMILATIPSNRSRRLAGVCALLTLLAMTPVIAGCHHKSSTTPTIPYTPTGTYKFTVQGSAQNAGRGFTVTVVVD
jgi:type III secretory pathway component EscR